MRRRRCTPVPSTVPKASDFHILKSALVSLAPHFSVIDSGDSSAIRSPPLK
jgi:hypothetical protein